MRAAERGHINAIKLLIHEKATLEYRDQVSLKRDNCRVQSLSY